jgi:Uma2 family endonuclease
MATVELTPSAGVRRDPFPRTWTAAEFDRARTLGVFAGRAAELIDGQIVERVGGELRPFVFTRKEYQGLDDAQFFRDQRVQLIAGELILESPVNRPHIKSVWKTVKAIERAFGDGYHVLSQSSLDLGQTSEPQPDAAVIPGSIDDYDAHPQSAVLVVEVSDTTFDFDTHEKASLYAAAGFADYWVVDLNGNRVLVMRTPEPREGEAHGHWYRSLTVHDSDGTIAPLAVPTARVRVADLLP